MVIRTYLNSGFTINAAGFDAEMVTESSQLKSKPCMDFDAAKASKRWNWYLIELACSINTKDCDAPKMRETVQDTAINFHGKSRRGFGLNR